jgi:hypothetical protein
MSGSNGPMWTMNDWFDYQNAWDEQKRKCDIEGAVLRSIDKRAKDSGLPIELRPIANRLRRRGSAEAELFVGQLLRISAANGVIQGPQLNAFAAAHYTPTDEIRQMANVAAAEDEGFRAGRGGLAKDANPYPVGSEESLAWVKWHGRGVAAQEHIMGARGTLAQASKEQPKARQRRKIPALPPPGEIKRRGRPPKPNGPTGEVVRRKPGRPRKQAAAPA